ncbi:MAG: hypothetical protein BGO67_06275 [Alphaproteobacteria bacterium 41-28]|nr:MAG: hypothetical protein BGO67_06275 [Alphaproteobacteria bacterium 41-28]
MKTTYFALLCILATPLMMANGVTAAEKPTCPDGGTYEEMTNSCLYKPFETCNLEKHTLVTITILGGPEKLNKTIQKCKSCLPGQKWSVADFKCE